MKAVPTRTCAATRVKLPKAQLLRIVRTPDGKVVADLDQNLPGRGVYVSPRVAAVDRLCAKGLVARALRASPDPGLRETLRAACRDAADAHASR